METLIVVLLLLDVVTTMIALRRGAYERNPVMAALMEKIGATPALIISHAALIVCVWFGNMDAWALWALAVIFVVVVANNLRVLR